MNKLLIYFINKLKQSPNYGTDGPFLIKKSRLGIYFTIITNVTLEIFDE
jgi:hypothetical protein